MKFARIVVSFLAVAIGLYPVIYFLVDRRFGLLSSKDAELLANTLWNIGFYTHIIFGGLSLLAGSTQFFPRLRGRRPKLHRLLGKIYVICVLLSGAASVGIGFAATGGIITSAGFILLGLFWLTSTALAYQSARSGEFGRHEYWMIFSYAACFAAVTLRIWLPLLMIAFGDFIVAYRIVAWLCWVPNLLVAWWIVSRKGVGEVRVS